MTFVISSGWGGQHGAKNKERNNEPEALTVISVTMTCNLHAPFYWFRSRPDEDLRSWRSRLLNF